MRSINAILSRPRFWDMRLRPDYPVMPDSYLAGDAANIYEYNLQKATALLAEAGWEDKDDDGIAENIDGMTINELTIELMILADDDDPYRHDVAENIATQLGECGIKTVFAEEEDSDYMTRLRNGNFEIALCSYYLNENPDITFMVGSGESINYGAFSDCDAGRAVAKLQNGTRAKMPCAKRILRWRIDLSTQCLKSACIIVRMH